MEYQSINGHALDVLGIAVSGSSSTAHDMSSLLRTHIEPIHYNPQHCIVRVTQYNEVNSCHSCGH